MTQKISKFNGLKIFENRRFEIEKFKKKCNGHFNNQRRSQEPCSRTLATVQNILGSPPGHASITVYRFARKLFCVCDHYVLFFSFSEQRSESVDEQRTINSNKEK
jgi:hypothetical protein